jgi:7-carboxy-7-deazaguanine synthase
LSKFKIAEKFISINGEGVRAGQLAVFIRFTGCNLNCSYCDTQWANQNDTAFEIMSENEIYNYIKKSGIKNVTLTGGEPLIQPDIEVLIEILSCDISLNIEIETNGSADISRISKISNPPSFTMDYKLPSSGMEKFMNTDNFSYLYKYDTVKFVAGSQYDLETAYQIIRKYNLTEKCHVYISPVFDAINPEDIVEFMKIHKLNDVNMQLQLHKFIWPPDKRGV